MSPSIFNEVSKSKDMILSKSGLIISYLIVPTDTDFAISFNSDVSRLAFRFFDSSKILFLRLDNIKSAST